MSFLQKLREASFPGTLYPINPKATEILGLRAYPNLSSLPVVPDLAMVCVAAAQVPTVLKECGRIDLRYVHILTAGFKEIGTEEARQLEDEIAPVAKEEGLLIIGPNCMGPYCPTSGLTAWGAIPGAPGPLGVISQSGAITQRLKGGIPAYPWVKRAARALIHLYRYYHRLNRIKTPDLG
jgi:acyl-CoA synthetase (NDP forming)